MLKKILAVTLSIGLLLTAFPYEFNAAEDSPTVTMESDEEIREILLSKAIEAFPEYEKEIRGENEINLGKARSGGAGEVVVSETRRLSDAEIVTYTEYDSGISTAAIGLGVGKNITNTTTGSSYTQYTMNMWLTCGNSPTMLFVEGVKFKINSNSYDQITNKGNITNYLCTTSSTIYENYVEKEGADNLAVLECGGYFEFTYNTGWGEVPYSIYGILKLEVGNNTYELSSSY